MKIQNLLAEAGIPVMADHSLPREATRRELMDKINRLGAGTALEEVLGDRRKLLYRGLRDTDNNVIHQDTLASTRSSQNTTNYVTWFTEILPSWHRVGFLPRSKIVSCTSSPNKAREYGAAYIVLPCESSQCVYTGAHDFWDAFEGINHVFNGGESVPAINDAMRKVGTKIITSSAGLKKACEELEVGLDSGKIRLDDLSYEMQALLNAHEDTHNVLEIIDNLMDPSHMRKSTGGQLLVPGDFKNGGEEVQVGGDIVYVKFTTFMDVFMPIGAAE